MERGEAGRVVVGGGEERVRGRYSVHVVVVVVVLIATSYFSRITTT